MSSSNNILVTNVTDEVIEKVLIYPVGNHKVEKDVIENLIKERFKQIGVEVLRLVLPSPSFLGGSLNHHTVFYLQQSSGIVTTP